MTKATILNQGGKASIRLNKPSDGQIGVGMGWDHEEGNRHIFDLDVSVVMNDTDSLMPDPAFFVYYGNIESPDKAVRHSGDNRSGVGLGDDEWLFVDLGLVDAQVTNILFIISIHEAQLKNQHFGLLPNAYIRIFEWESKEELLRYNLKDALRFFDTGEFARLVRKGSQEWEFVATGQGEHGGLNTILTMYKKPGH